MSNDISRKVKVISKLVKTEHKGKTPLQQTRQAIEMIHNSEDKYGR